VFVPAATPKDIVDKLSAELGRIIRSPEGVAGLQAVNLIAVGDSAESFQKTLRRDFDRWAAVAKTAGVKGE
jgi:tripartite-type tricarboxylate transporter receptor subunit TctC